ncbi:hypothetical protein LEP1GSC132_3387 [Leptospira kirschneri str. 200803703]|uniref:Uncharacterized protein n=1 Tax=Leptospira kirschneri str. 200802841 TaxID=1193047 RepID=A0A828Y5X5_9LEPT|nr:hypothetical protein LEP1GSC044_1665 [Leptospira kirschneri serovar Grippotyphosa str. RM52]EKO50637.1 hypothetical protein LEP1GSC131_0754 [Leptospira kirschneri str. 200802841]EKQ83893.1 hypothetical protein LEP1GSC064_3665 [Leptospira kirschneri serovar Grippotyphosa str. Moskva]EKR10467.1 hypothetical protein LEP1GSC122_3839 [Leptospira kirschneri serovar Valbuzzi str. 200702274]EMJ94569.1 hypothetical protein LEP1GSC198_3224 [Leptospira kirschneri str. JB]EMK05078.1 hypothetical protei
MTVLCPIFRYDPMLLRTHKKTALKMNGGFLEKSRSSYKLHRS